MASWISEIAGRRVRVVAIIAAASVVSVIVPVARAQPAAPTDAARAAARRELVEGVAAMKKGDYQTALARFEAAYAIVPSPKIHYDFGLAYVGLGRSAEALAAFERFLAEAPDAPPDKRENAASHVADLRARIAETSGRDDRDGTGAPPVVPGTHPDAVPTTDPAPAASRADDATVATTVAPDPLRARRITAISVGAAGVGLVAVGLVFGVLARREGDSLTHDSQIATPDRPTPFDPGKESRGLAYERLEVIGLVTGAVAVAAGTVIYATSRRRVEVEPAAGNALGGATLRVRF